MLVGDLIEIRSRSVLAAPLSAELSDIRASFFPTREALQICAGLVQRAGVPGRKMAGVLLCGSPGAGKTHIVRYAEALLASPGDQDWERLAPFLAQDQLMPAPVRTLLLPVPGDPNVDLAEALCLDLVTEAGNLPPIARLSPEQYRTLISDAAPRLLSRSVGLVVVEDLARRLRRFQDPGRAQADVEFCAALLRILCEHGILVAVTVPHASAQAMERSLLAPLAACCDIMQVSRRNLAETISALASKTEVQRNRIREIVERVQASLPLLGCRTEDAVGLYPFHVPLFNALFVARRSRPEFSPLDFALSALKTSGEWPADRLITLDVLFDYLMRHFRADEHLGDHVAAFYECEHELSQLSPTLGGQAMLKAIAFGSMCGNGDRSIKWLTEQVLPAVGPGLGSAYSGACGLLAEMERCCPGKLCARGGGIERRYGLAADEAAHSGSRTSGGNLRVRAPLMVYDWIHSEVPCWNPEFSAKYLRRSQTLVAGAPDGRPERKGIVHLHNALEPLWSDEDISALKESGAEWALLVLPPFERPKDTDLRIREITHGWNRILVWRPDQPSLPEARRLRRLAAAYALPARAGARWKKLRARARRLLHALYVRRGLLFTVEDHWTPSAELENDSVVPALSRAIRSLPGLAPRTQVAITSGDSPTAPSEKVLAWAALISDSATRPESDVMGERNLLSWWASRLEVDCSALVTRLHGLPESFTTIRMGDEIRFFESSLGLIRSALQRLRNRELSFADAIGQIAAHFGDDESRLLKWRKSLDNFAGLARWLPAYEYAREYLDGAFDTGKPDIDQRRRLLLQSCGYPHRMLDAGQRDAFDAGFLQFKKLYTEAYSSLHEEAIGRVQPRVDPVAVHTLELLSRLDHADTAWFQKVQLIAKWARSNECDLPVRDILDRYPRCYCNFNPSVRQHVTEPVARINMLIREGTEYFRAALRNCSKTIMEEMTALGASDEIVRQVASLLSHGPAIPVDCDTIDFLNTVVQSHAGQFRAELSPVKRQDVSSR